MSTPPQEEGHWKRAFRCREERWPERSAQMQASRRCTARQIFSELGRLRAANPGSVWEPLRFLERTHFRCEEAAAAPGGHKRQFRALKEGARRCSPLRASTCWLAPRGRGCSWTKPLAGGVHRQTSERHPVGAGPAPGATQRRLHPVGAPHCRYGAVGSGSRGSDALASASASFSGSGGLPRWSSNPAQWARSASSGVA